MGQCGSYTNGMDASDDTLRLHLTLPLPLAATHEIDTQVRMVFKSLPMDTRHHPAARR
jgi:hypothetical protein